MQDAEILEDRQRIDRWLEESQYLTGRLIPGFLDDRDRLRGKLQNVEQDCERFRTEVGELRKEIGRLQSEVQFYQGEHTAAAEAFVSIMEQLGHLQKPVGDLYRRFQSAHPTSEVTV